MAGSSVSVPVMQAKSRSDFGAILFAIAGFTFWMLSDSCIKWTGQRGLPPYEIVACMGAVMAVTLAADAALRGNLDNLRPRSVPRQFLRSLLDLGNNICVVIALRHLSLTMFYILVFTSPLVTSALSRAFLGERISRKRALALAAGFCGVVIAVAPWGHSSHVDLIGVLSCMVCVACFSTNMVWSRLLTRTEPPQSLAFFSAIVTGVTGLAFTGLRPHPIAPSLAVVLGFMGVCCAIGTLCFYIAVKHTSAGNVSQYHYTQLVTGAVVSWFVWRDKPGLPVILGGLLILGSGVMIALEARNAGRDQGSVL